MKLDLTKYDLNQVLKIVFDYQEWIYHVKAVDLTCTVSICNIIPYTGKFFEATIFK